MPGHWDFNETTGQPEWVEDAPMEPIDWTTYYDKPYGGYLPVIQRPVPPPDYPDPSGGQSPGIYTPGPLGTSSPSSGYQPPAQPGGGGPNPAPGYNPGGGGGGGGGGGAPDPYAWMADFGGPEVFKAYLRNAGERIQDYYSRLAGDPLKTLVNKYQTIKGMAPTTELRNMMVGALGWGGVIDPNTLEPIAIGPNSELLQGISKTGGNYNSYSKNTGLRYVGTRPWTDIAKDFRQWSVPGAAVWPPATA